MKGLQYIIENIGDMPDLLHLAGTETMSYYRFWCLIAKEAGVDEKLIIPSRERLENRVPRPFRGGLSVGKARKLGVPLFSATME